MPMRYLALTLLLAPSAVGLSQATSPAPAAVGPLGRALDAYLQRAAGVGFSGAALVEWNGTVILRGTYGWLDRRRLEKPSIETAFPISSNTKMFTAALAGVLVSQGKLHFTDSISRFFPDAPADKRAITIHQLLTHTAGLADTYAAESTTIPEGIRRILATPLTHSIGAQWDYSNDGFHLLEGILEIAGGHSIDTLRQQLLFDPAGMTATGTRRSGHRWSSMAHGQNLLSDFTPSAAVVQPGRSGLASTIDDLYAWSRAWRRGRILSSAMREQFATPYMPVQKGVNQTYGMFVMDTPLGRALRMGGNDTPPGYTSEYRLYLEHDGFLTLLNNSMWDLTPFIRRIRTAIETMLAGGTAPLLPEAVLPHSTTGEKLRGNYRATAGTKIIIWAQGRTLLVGAEGQRAIDALFPADSVSEIARRAAYTRKAATVISEALATAPPAAPPVSPLTKALTEVRRDMGAITGWDTLGTAPTPSDDDATGTTYLRLRGRRGSEVIRIVWSGDDIAAVIRGTPRPFLPIVKLSDGGLAAYSFFDARSVQLRLTSPNKGSSGTTLTIGDGAGQPVFYRQLH